MDFARSIVLWVLNLVEGVVVRLANLPRRTDRLFARYPSYDLLKAHRISRRLRDADEVLDIGCGNGHVLDELGLFRELRRVGIDVDQGPAPVGVTRAAYDGWSVPFADDSFDVTLVCYVLHHLTREHARHLLSEAIRVSRRRVILLEDSLPRFGLFYRIRNRLHRVGMDLRYRAQSNRFRPVGNEAMFLTHDGWRDLLCSLEGVAEAHVEELGPLCRYRHHVLIDVRLAREASQESEAVARVA